MSEERAQVFFLDAVSDVKPDVRKSLTTLAAHWLTSPSSPASSLAQTQHPGEVSRPRPAPGTARRGGGHLLAVPCSRSLGRLCHLLEQN